MTVPKNTETGESPLAQDILQYCKAQFGNRRSVAMLTAAGASAAIALNWSWLVAVGIAPVLIAVLPCLVMCGLGLCMNRAMGSSCESSSSSNNPDPGGGTTTRLNAGSIGLAEGSVPLVRRQPARRKRKQAARRQTRATATSGKET